MHTPIGLESNRFSHRVENILGQPTDPPFHCVLVTCKSDYKVTNRENKPHLCTPHRWRQVVGCNKFYTIPVRYPGFNRVLNSKVPIKYQCMEFSTYLFIYRRCRAWKINLLRIWMAIKHAFPAISRITGGSSGVNLLNQMAGTEQHGWRHFLPRPLGKRRGEGVLHVE